MLRTRFVLLFTIVTLFPAGPIYAQETEEEAEAAEELEEEVEEVFEEVEDVVAETRDIVIETTFEDQTAVEALATDDDFTMFVGALQATGMAETLQSEGPYTIFVPTDDAFEDLGDDVVEALFAPENQDDLAEVIRYHIIPGGLLVEPGEIETSGFEALEHTQRYETLQGSVLTVTPGQAAFLVNEAAILKPNVITADGVIHVVDKVLLPPGREEKARE